MYIYCRPEGSKHIWNSMSNTRSWSTCHTWSVVYWLTSSQVGFGYHDKLQSICQITSLIKTYGRSWWLLCANTVVSRITRADPSFLKGGGQKYQNHLSVNLIVYNMLRVVFQRNKCGEGASDTNYFNSARTLLEGWLLFAASHITWLTIKFTIIVQTCPLFWLAVAGHIYTPETI